jgi:hypothetical protein
MTALHIVSAKRPDAEDGSRGWVLYTEIPSRF